jgi:hypothetical protein
MDESSEYRSQAMASEGNRPTTVPQPAVNWRVLAVFVAGSLLGVPFVASGTAHAAWLHLAQTFAFLRH